LKTVAKKILSRESMHCAWSNDEKVIIQNVFLCDSECRSVCVVQKLLLDALIFIYFFVFLARVLVEML